MSFDIAFLPGDGVGPEVANAARKVLETVDQKFGLSLAFRDCLFGGAAIDATGVPFPDETRAACKSADAVFLGAVGGPKWDGGKARPEQGLLDLRKTLNVYANLRPLKAFPGLDHLTPLRPELVHGIDLIIVRELTGGIYFGDREEGDDKAVDYCPYSREEIDRVARVAFKIAAGRDGRLVSVDKANVLATSRLWRACVNRMQREEFPQVDVEHILVDAMAMKLIQNPSSYDVILTENLFGDILSDEASVLTGSIGLAASASVGEGTLGLYEPIHGSAPDIAGQNIANPLGAILSAAMMLRHSGAREDAAMAVEEATLECLASGVMTKDLGGTASCSDVADKIMASLS